MKLFQKMVWLALALWLLVLSACGPKTAEPPRQADSGELASSQKGSNEEKSEPSGLEEIESEPAVPVGLVGKGESVADEWFADAVFLGNSLTDGLELYSGIKNASFISHQGLSVFNIASKECIDTEAGTVTAITALGQQKWAKVYLMLGVNELGYGGESFREAFTDVVKQIKECQPEAAIYLQTILPVNEGIAEQKGISSSITNERVILFNNMIAEIADSEGTALVDVAAAFWTEAGEMAADNTRDGVHLTRQGYIDWYEYLKSHTGTTKLLEEPGEHIYIPASRPAKRPPKQEESGEPEPQQPEEIEDPQETQQSEEPQETKEPGEIKDPPLEAIEETGETNDPPPQETRSGGV